MTRFCTCTGDLVSSLELRRKRREVAKAFCNTCGRLLVDGIGPKSASMLSTVDIELTKFINPDLTWKRVRKGHRSASRRSRKPASSLDMGAVQPDDNSPKRADESSVSESEKLGVAVLGRRFAEKVEHVPIKKRRLFLHSPSPPSQTPSPHHKDSLSPQWPCPESISKGQIETFNGSVAVVKCSQGVDGIVYGKLSEVTHEKIGCNDEFSGIALLAAAACNNNIDDDDDDDDNVKERPAVEESLNPEVDLSVSATPLEETISSSKTGDFFQNGSVHEEKIDNGDVGTVKGFVCNDRLNWDLNTVMDAWERPSDDVAIDSEKNVADNTNHNDVKHTEKVENMEDSERAMGPEDGKQDKENKVQSSSDLHRNHMLVDSKETDIGSCELNRVECLLEACTDSEKTGLKEKSVCTLTEHRPEPLHASADTNAPSLLVGTETPIDNLPCLGSGHILSTHVSVTCQISDTEFSLNNSDKFSSPKCKSSSSLVPFVEEVETIVQEDGKGQGEKASKAATTLIGSSLLVMANSNGKDSTSHSGKTYSEGHYDARDFLDCSRDGQGCMVDLENVIELRAGYESPFEDGELRDSVLYPWEENEAEWDNECVDYESDNGDSMSEKVEDEQCGRRDALKDLASLKKKASGWDKLPEGCERSTERTGNVDDVSTRPVHTSGSTDGVNKGLLIREKGASRANNGKLSHVEGPSSSDVYFRRSRSKNLDDSYPRSEREFGPYKSQIHDGSQEDDQWVGSSADCRDSRNRYPSSFHRYDRGPTRPSNIIANSAAQVDHLAFRDSRKSMNYSLEGVYRPLGRRRSPIPTRDMSRIRSQGRSRIYQEPISGDPALSSVHVPLHLTSRERSYSPTQSRVAHFSRPRRRSRSRSRTRSPLSWHFHRERNTGPRNHSRSPDFRSEARIRRTRLPIQKSSVAEDDEESFMPVSRERFFPQFDSRWVRDRDCEADRFRGRRSPVRIFRRSQRFDLVSSPGRLKSDDYFRPMMRPGGPNRGTKYEYGDDDMRKRGDKYEMIHRVRHDNGGDMVRRFRYDADHASYNKDNCIGSADRRDVYRSSRDDRGAFRYNNNNRMYNTGPKSSSRIQSYDDDASARRG